MRARSKPSSAGMTLIEVIVASSLLLVIGVAAARILDLVTRVGVEAVAESQGRRAIVRLVEPLREDVALAADVELGEDARSVELRREDQRIVYRWDEGSSTLQRIRLVPRHQVHEAYQLPERCELSFAVSPQRVTLDIHHDRELWRVEANR